MTGFSRSIEVFRRAAASALVVMGISLAPAASAESLNLTHDEPFYRQLLKLPDRHDYLPTRSFTIIVDAEHGNQLVAEDDPNLRFNLLWMKQFQPGYRSSVGGSAFGELIRSYLKMAYRAYREDNAQELAALPDENGSIHARQDATDLIDAMDYNFKLTGDEVRLKIQYNY